MAENCGSPAPETIRVVQIEPGPIPILTISAPASTSALAPATVPTLHYRRPYSNLEMPLSTL